MSGVKHDGGKLRPSLMPWESMLPVLRVMEYGARKYSPDGWRDVPEPRLRYWDAAMRHMLAWALGERTDPESGETHLAHAVCSLLYIISFEDGAAEAAAPDMQTRKTR